MSLLDIAIAHEVMVNKKNELIAEGYKIPQIFSADGSKINTVTLNSILADKGGTRTRFFFSVFDEQLLNLHLRYAKLKTDYYGNQYTSLAM